MSSAAVYILRGSTGRVLFVGGMLCGVGALPSQCRPSWRGWSATLHLATIAEMAQSVTAIEQAFAGDDANHATIGEPQRVLHGLFAVASRLDGLPSIGRKKFP